MLGSDGENTCGTNRRIYVPRPRTGGHIQSPTQSVWNICDGQNSGGFERFQAQVGLNKSKDKVKLLMKNHLTSCEPHEAQPHPSGTSGVIKRTAKNEWTHPEPGAEAAGKAFTMSD